MGKLAVVKCPQCEKEFKQKNQYHKFCSIECKKDFYGIKPRQEIKVCQNCGKEYTPKAHDTNSKYCSRVCKDISRGRSGKGLNKEAICPVCSKVFTQKSANHKFCSSKCKETDRRNKNKEQNQLPQRTCEACGNLFIPKKESSRFCYEIKIKICPVCGKEYESSCGDFRKTCSKECGKILNVENGKKTCLKKYGVERPAQSETIKEKTREQNLKKFGTTCSVHNPEIKKKVEATNLKRYGTKHYFASEQGKQTVIDKNMERFGVPCSLSAPEIKEKIKKTNLERYGTENPFSSDEIREKIKESCIANLGVDNPFKSDEVREKIKQTNLERYGVENPFASVEVKNKIKQTFLKKYGVENLMQSPEIRERVRQTNLKRYGSEETFKSKVVRAKIKKSMLERYGALSYNGAVNHPKEWNNLKSFLEENSKKYNISDLAKYFNVQLGTATRRVSENGLQYHVKDFSKYTLPEFFCKLMLENIGLKEYVDFIPHNRKVITPLEVDFYLPEYKLAIEVSPTWTHNIDCIKDPHYHYNKFKLCQEKGIELITIFDWHKLEKIEKFILSKLNKERKRVYARSCKVLSVNSVTKYHKEFLENNHILGKVNNSKWSTVYEILHENKVVGIAIFEKKNGFSELRRLAFLEDYQVIGGASKLIKAWRKENSEPLVTFSDNDLGNGSVYSKLGFRKLTENKGTLIWWNERYQIKIPNLSLVRQGADRLLKNFPGYIPVGMGENLPSNQEILVNYGFTPVFDCGYTKWILE